MPQNLTNADLREIFKRRMASCGTPIERVDRSGGPSQLYKFAAGPNTGKRLRLRTNHEWAVMSIADGTDSNEPIPSLESADFVGIACINTETGAVECYEVPATRVVGDMKVGHRDATRGRDSGSKVRILYFRNHEEERSWYGFASKYARFMIPGEDTAPVAETPPRADSGGDVIERARRMISEAFGVPPSAIRISIDLVHDRL
jgi:hypothetical protein